MTSDTLPSAPAFARNAGPIFEVLSGLPWPGGAILEIGSRTGEHAARYARALAPRPWIPSDRPGHLGDIEARRRAERTENMRRPLPIDLLEADWPESSGAIEHELAGIVAINVLHIAPAAAIAGLFEGASRLLGAGAIVYLYGPYSARDRELEPSNRAFDARLRAEIEGAGLRSEEEVAREASARGFALEASVAMPANNRSLWFVRRGER